MSYWKKQGRLATLLKKMKKSWTQMTMLCLGGSSKVIWGKKPGKCQKIYLELCQIRSRNRPFSQALSSTQRMGGDQMSIKKDSTTSLQGVTNKVWGSTFLRKESSVSLLRESRKYVPFQWEENLFKFVCLCFGLGPAPWIFIKLLKVPISLIRRIQIHLVI